MAVDLTNEVYQLKKRWYFGCLSCRFPSFKTSFIDWCIDQKFNILFSVFDIVELCTWRHKFPRTERYLIIMLITKFVFPLFQSLNKVYQSTSVLLSSRFKQPQNPYGTMIPALIEIFSWIPETWVADNFSIHKVDTSIRL